MAINDYYKFFAKDFSNSSNTVEKSKKMSLTVYKNLVGQKSNTVSPTLLLDKLTPSQINLLKNLLHELEELTLVEELLNMKIYYQTNPDPRNLDNKALYAKAVLPKYKNHQKRKHLGIHFGTLKNHPEGWTSKNQFAAKNELIKKAFNMLTGE